MADHQVRLDADSDALAGLHRRRSAAARWRAGLAALLPLPQVTGCYQYVPVTTATPAAGREVTIDISDRGRVALASQLGPGARRVHGRILQAGDTAYVLGLSGVEYLGTSSLAKWSGEVVSVSRDYVTDVRERRLSRGRSWLAAGLVVVLAAAVSTIAIVGFGSEGGDTRTPPDGGDTE